MPRKKNRKQPKTKKSYRHYTGVTWIDKSKRWRAVLKTTFAGTIELGLYRTSYQAADARDNAIIMFGTRHKIQITKNKWDGKFE